MKLIATIALAMFFAIKAMSMQNPERVADGIVFALFDLLFQQDIDLLSKTCVRFRDLANEYNKLKYSEFLAFNMPKGHKVVFFSSEETFCMSYQDNGRPALKTFDYKESKEQEIPLVFDPSNKHFAPHKTGIYFATRQMLDVLHKGETLIYKVFCIDEHIILENCPGNITVFNVKNRQLGACFYQVDFICGFEERLFIFCTNGTFELINPNFSVRTVKIGDSPVQAVVGSKELMVTCHKCLTSSSLKFFKTHYLNRDADSSIISEGMNLTLPTTFSVRQLLLRGDILFVVASPSVGDEWLLISYSVDKNHLIHHQKFQTPILEAHLGDKNIFVVAKSSNRGEEDLFEVKTINIEKLLK